MEYEINKENIKELLESSSAMKPYISEGKVWIEKRKFDLTCEITTAIFKRDALIYENAQVQLIRENIENNIIGFNDCRIKRTKFLDSESDISRRRFVVCMICARFCREVY